MRRVGHLRAQPQTKQVQAMLRGEHVRAQPRKNQMQTGGSGMCDHNRERRWCKQCGGSSICEHNRERSGLLRMQATQREQVQGLPAEGGLVLPLHTQAQTDTQAQAKAHTKPHNNTLELMEPFLNKIKSCQIANGIFGEQMSLQCSALSYLWLKRCAAVRVILHREQCIAAAPLEAYTSGLGRQKLARHPD